jgi:hypothetical protein
MAQPLLEERSSADECTRLRREIAGLEQELQQTKETANKAKRAAEDSIQAIRALRSQLQPLYTALKMIFGEIARVETGTIGNTPGFTGPGGLNPKWEMLKTRLGGRQAEFIDLMQHGEMTAAQLRAAAHCDIRTAYATIEKMKAAGLLNKNGGKFSLKEL